MINIHWELLPLILTVILYILHIILYNYGEENGFLYFLGGLYVVVYYLSASFYIFLLLDWIFKHINII